MNRLRERQGDRRIAAELRSWGAPGLAARGIHQREGMGRLLTREIKSSRDREYLYAHLLALRRRFITGSAAKLHFSRLLNGRTFCLGLREDDKGFTLDAALRGLPPPPAEPSDCCLGSTGDRSRARRDPCKPLPPPCLPRQLLLAGPWSPPVPQRGEQKHGFPDLRGNLSGKAPAPSRGDVDGRGCGCWSLESDSFKVGTGLLTSASFTPTAHTTCEHLKNPLKRGGWHGH